MSIVHLDTTDSTMHEAARLAAAGCPSGTVVIADEQTGGLGRHGRSWYSEKGSGLYCSIVLRMDIVPDTLPVLTLALGLATAEAIARSTGIACDLRWPNDVLIDGKKAAGILVQLQDQAVIAGIGINLNHAAFPEEIAMEATSLRLATGRCYSREDLLDSLLPAVDSFAKMLLEGGREAILGMFQRASSYARGKRVVIDGVYEATTAGVDPAGFLKVRKDDGTETLVLAGGVRAAGS